MLFSFGVLVRFVGNEKVAFDFRTNGKDPEFIADGVTIDRDGLLWVGLFQGSSVIAIDTK